MSIARPVENVVEQLQADASMVPFVLSSIEELLNEVLQRFMNQELLDSNVSIPKRLWLDLEANNKRLRSVHIGYGSDIGRHIVNYISFILHFRYGAQEAIANIHDVTAVNNFYKRVFGEPKHYANVTHS